MKESFKESFGWFLGKFCAELIINSIRSILFWTEKYVKNPEKTKNEIKEIIKEESPKTEKIKFGFM